LAFISPPLCASAQDKSGVSDITGFNSGPATKTQLGVYGQISHYQPNDGFLEESYHTALNGVKKMYSAGFSLRYKISRHFTISTGTGLTCKRFETYGLGLEDTTYPDYTPSLAGSWNCQPMMQTTLYSNQQSLSVDIPLLLQYYPFKNQLFVSSGLEFNFGIYDSYKSAYRSYDGTVTKINHSGLGEGYNIMMPLSAGLNLPLLQKKMLSIEPGIKVLVANKNSFDNYVGLYTLRASFYF
jgi:hypothetical protein